MKAGRPEDRPGIVTHFFKIPEVQPDDQRTVESSESGEQHQIFLWITPLAPAE